MKNWNTYVNQNEDEILARFTGYVTTALRNGKIRYLSRKSRDSRNLSLDELLDHVDEPDIQSDLELITYNSFDGLFNNEATLEDMISNDSLLIAILKLNDRERRIINLHLLQKMKFSDIADLLDMKKKTAEKCYERAIKKIRSHLEGGATYVKL